MPFSKFSNSLLLLVAIVLLSGGQGTRLGFEHAKGMYNIGMPSNKSLFQYFSERIQRLASLGKFFGCNKTNFSYILIALEKTGEKGKAPNELINFYIMTSEMNNEEIQKYFADNEFFGFSPKSIHFFCQVNPALSTENTYYFYLSSKVSLHWISQARSFLSKRTNFPWHLMAMEAVSRLFPI